MEWKPLIEDENIYNAVKNKIYEIYDTVVNYYDEENSGLLGGYGGCILFLYYFYRFTKKEEHLLMLQKKCEEVLEDFLHSKTAAYCNGYSGICWLIRFFTNEGIIESSDVDETLTEIDKINHHLMLMHVKQNNFDFLHGALGIGYYFVTQNNKCGDVGIQNLLSELENNIIHNPDGSIKWLSNVFIKKYETSLVYNFGVAHGMASTAGFLTELVKVNKNEIIARRLLSDLILFYNNNTNPTTFRSVFPTWITAEGDRYAESRLAWCYGDLGISPILYKAGMVLNDSKLKEFALNILIKSCSRKDYKLDQVMDACFCHGTSGVAHIYNRMYQKTNILAFKDSALYWLKETLKMGNNPNEFAGYIFIHSGHYTSNFSLLSGVSGVGLSLLATIDSSEPKWDECLMLS